MRWLVVVVVPLFVTLIGCSSGPTAEEAFVSDVQATPGYSRSSNLNADLLRNGREVCAVMDTPGVTEQSMIGSLVLVGYTYPAGEIVADQAVEHLCPGKVWPVTALTPEQAYLADIDDTPGLTRTGPDSEIITLGRMVCDAIGTPGITRANFEAAIGTSKYGPAVAPVILDAAERHLCPGKLYSNAPAVAVPGFSPPAVLAPVPAGPATTIGDGTHEVGVDVAPGKYKTAGGQDCYYARLRNTDGGVENILDNNLGAGPQTVTIKAGEYFESQGCGTWTKAG